MNVTLLSETRVPRGTQIEIYAAHPSGLVVVGGTVTVASGHEVSVRIDRPFAEPTDRDFAGSTLNVFVRREGATGDPVPAELLLIWSGGAVLTSEGEPFSKHDDVQIVFRRDHARWASVNGEVT